MKITYKLIHDAVLKLVYETGEEFYAIEGEGEVSKEEAMKYIHRKRFEEWHKRHKEFLDIWVEKI